MEKLILQIESLVFVANPSISFDDIKNALNECFDIVIEDDQIAECIATLKEKYNNENFAMELVEMSGGFRFLTKPAYHNVIGTYLKQNTHKKLSKSAIETLAIIAYKQPVTKAELESIRGVNSDYTVQKLLEKDLIEILGRSDGPGKPLIYGTTNKFTDYFGLKSIEDLPKPVEIEPLENSIGEQAPIEEELNRIKIGLNKQEEE